MFREHSTQLISAFTLLLSLSFNDPVLAQDAEKALAGDVAPQMRGVLKNSDIVLERLETVLNLTTAEEQEQYATLKDFVDVFLIGVDPQKPVSMDVLTGGEETSYRLNVPINGFNNFWKSNLQPLGIPVQGFAKQPGLYRLGGRRNDAFDGYMVYKAGQRADYATIIDDAKHLPAINGPDPTQNVQNLLQAGYDAAIQLQNRAEGVEPRHAYYAGEREEVLGRLKRDAEESASDFNLRKFAAGVQYDEIERIYAEAKNVIVGMSVAPNPAQATASLLLEPLAGTSLDKAIQEIGKNASRFAGIPAGENTAATGRINFPIDEFHKQNYLALSQKLRENEIEEMESLEGATNEQKEAGKKLLNGFFDRIDAGLQAGVIDGFVEMTKNPQGIYSVVGGIISPNAAEWVPVLETMPQTKDGPQVKTNTGNHAGVTYHELMLSKEKHPDFAELFGNERLLVGIGEKEIWYAAGPDAEQSLAQAIDQAAQAGEPNPTIVTFKGELLPGLRVLDRRLGESGFNKFRDLAIEAFQSGEGRVDMNLVKDGNAIKGETKLDQGVLRLVGKALASFSKENLAE